MSRADESPAIRRRWVQTWPGETLPRPYNTFCFPHLGGGTASFRLWQRLAPSLRVHAICLPGRECHLLEPPRTDMRQLVAEIVDVISPFLTAPYLFFGHSMGAYLAYECAALIQSRALVPPEHLFVGGAEAPEYGAARLAMLPGDVDPVDWLVHLGGMPLEVVESKELIEFITPAVRGDFAMLASYTPSSASLRTALTVFYGRDDTIVDQGRIGSWAARADRTSFVELEGNHFAHLTEPAPLVQEILKTTNAPGT